MHQIIKKTQRTDLLNIITTREDAFELLKSYDVDIKDAFVISETIRKGKGISDDDIKKIKNCGVPEWFIKVAKESLYIFPRAHIIAFTIISLKLAYFKAHFH